MEVKETDFFDQVFKVVRLIPEGRVTSYGAIAKYLGAPTSSRIVGYAMNASHSQKEKVPAHRVLNRNGKLTGKHHFSNPFMMQELLEKENIIIKNDTVQDFNNHYWDPTFELSL